MTLRLGCIADDLTGASDLAGELVARGLRTVQTIGIPDGALPDDLDAVVVALKSRTVPAEQAVQESLAALRWLRAAGCERIFQKYCSTFDSTPDGNIGPVLDALTAELDAGFSIACPAFPANRRTVYQGHLFVNGKPLNESGMERHPLTPMTDANLVRVLQAQTATRVGLIPLEEIRADRVAAAARRLIDENVGVAIADAVDDDDLATLGAYCADRPLASGGSGLGAGIARALAGAGARSAPAVLPSTGLRRAAVAGSCSIATRAQVATFAANHPALRIAIEAERSPAKIVAAACDWFDAQDPSEPALVYSTADPIEVERQRNLRADASGVLEDMLSDIADHMVARGVRALIVAGGETSGAVVQRLGVRALRIGPEIDPGVPWTVGLRPGAPELVLALKSGNFGSEDFLLKAWSLLP